MREMNMDLPDVIAILVCLLAEDDGTVHSEILMEESASRQPHPVAGVQAVVSVEKPLFKDLP